MEILEQHVLSLRLGEALLYYHHILYILQQRVSVLKNRNRKLERRALAERGGGEPNNSVCKSFKEL